MVIEIIILNPSHVKLWAGIHELLIEILACYSLSIQVTLSLIGEVARGLLTEEDKLIASV